MADLDTNTTYDAQQLVEEIASGEEKAPKVNADADYERSKQFDVAEIDRTGAKPAAKATAPQSGGASTAAPSGTESATGNPADFIEMAKEVTPDLES